MIKSIHQTWKNKTPPEDIFRSEWVNSSIQHNPGWDYSLWTDEENCWWHSYHSDHNMMTEYGARILGE